MCPCKEKQSWLSKTTKWWLAKEQTREDRGLIFNASYDRGMKSKAVDSKGQPI